MNLTLRQGSAAAPLGAVLLVAAAACGEISDPPSPPVGNGGSAQAGAGGRAGNAGSGGSGGGSGGSMAGGGSEPDAGGPTGGSSNGGSGAFMYPEGCPEPDPVPITGQTVAIQSINFSTSEIVLRNVSSDDVVIEGGEMGWQWCNFPYYNLVVLNNVTLEPGQTLAFRPINQGRVWTLYPGDQGDPNEFAIYTTTGSFMTAGLMASFVSWGAGLSGGRESVAVTAGLWTFNERVEIASGDDGLIATGNTDRGDGYTSVPERCLVAPPNPPGAMIPEPD